MDVPVAKTLSDERANALLQLQFADHQMQQIAAKTRPISFLKPMKAKADAITENALCVSYWSIEAGWFCSDPPPEVPYLQV